MSLMNKAFILFVMLMTSVKSSYAEDVIPYGDLHNLKLTINIIERPETFVHIKAVIQNISENKVKIYFEHCEICFWRYSVRNIGFHAVNGRVHRSICSFRHLITLESGESVSKSLKIFNAYSSIKTGDSLKIRYKLFGKERKQFLISNTIEVR